MAGAERVGQVILPQVLLPALLAHQLAELVNVLDRNHFWFLTISFDFVTLGVLVIKVEQFHSIQSENRIMTI